jgi:hypothetical protein
MTGSAWGWDLAEIETPGFCIAKTLPENWGTGSSFFAENCRNNGKLSGLFTKRSVGRRALFTHRENVDIRYHSTAYGALLQVGEG